MMGEGNFPDEITALAKCSCRLILISKSNMNNWVSARLEEEVKIYSTFMQDSRAAAARHECVLCVFDLHFKFCGSKDAANGE